MLVSSGQTGWMQLLLDFLKERAHSSVADPLNYFSPPVSTEGNSYFSKFETTTGKTSEETCNFSTHLLPSSLHLCHTLLGLSHSLPFRMPLKKSENGFHSRAAVWANTLVHSHTHPQAPLLECQVSSSGTAAIAAASRSSTVWLLYHAGRMFAGRPAGRGLCCVECVNVETTCI